MAEFPAMPLWTDAYLGDTTHLTTIEHGAYLLLLITMWRAKGNTLPDDDKMLARYTRLNLGQWRRIRPVIEPFFHVENGEWWNKRLLDELESVRRVTSQRSNAGKASALKRQHRGSTGVPTKTQRESNTHTHTHTQKTQDTESGKSPGGDLLSMNGAEPKGPPPFDEWWKVYPRKANKGGAEKAFKAALKKASLETLTTAARNYAESCKAQGTEEKYIAHAATWLNQERWNDWLQPQTSGNDYGPGYRVVAGTLIRDRSQH